MKQTELRLPSSALLGAFLFSASTLTLLAFWGEMSGAVTRAAEPAAKVSPRNELLQGGQVIHIPGPNPILTIGKPGSWDDIKIEACDALKDFGTYYVYYHGYHDLPEREGFQIGVATSTNPLGPFKRHGDQPILRHGIKGSWDENNVACVMVMKERPESYLMWYSGLGYPPKHDASWDIGLATAPSPVGPWKKHSQDPVLENFGYLGSVVKAQGKYYLFAAHPVGSVAPDYSPMSVAVADRPEGPFRPYEGNPVLREGQAGEWDSGGFSEAEVLYHGGLFHLFYGGAEVHPNRMLSREHIGYAYSFDGFHWAKYGRNPVARLENNPPVAAFSEVHSIIELPLVYMYHTQRYTQSCRFHGIDRQPHDEDLGVQVLVTQRPFSLEMPLLNLETLPAGRTVSPDAASPVNLSHITRLALIAECTYAREAREGIRLHVVSSPDGLKFDTTDLHTLDNVFRPGQTCRKTFPLEPDVRFIKVLVENLDPSESVVDLKISATLGG